MDLEAVRVALRAQKPDLLLEQPEGQWLDAKTVPYALRDPREVEELAKDVCAFANGGGGVLVLGLPRVWWTTWRSSTGSSRSTAPRSTATRSAS
ncbi:AlbA family DNA-binding domain-containing protein [Streptomyces collinus]|uniref:AlbA family DNA-binding domain-containing protein n=1 Tax=Streptomyces collinus TaxID=42684 RepID=UPI003439003A